MYDPCHGSTTFSGRGSAYATSFHCSLSFAPPIAGLSFIGALSAKILGFIKPHTITSPLHSLSLPHLNSSTNTHTLPEPYAAPKPKREVFFFCRLIRGWFRRPFRLFSFFASSHFRSKNEKTKVKSERPSTFERQKRTPFNV